MDHHAVTAAVQTLRSGGQRVSVRAVHGITGGSFRDVSRLLKESLADDELADLEAEAMEPAPLITEDTPQLGRIAEAEARYAEAQVARRQAYAAYRDADRRLWEAKQLPAPRTGGVEASVLVATRQVAAQATEVAETEATLLKDTYEASLRAEEQAKRAVESLEQRAATLTRDVHTLRQTVEWARRERDRVAHELDALRKQVRTREADVETAERQLANALAELEALGEGVVR